MFTNVILKGTLLSLPCALSYLFFLFFFIYDYEPLQDRDTLCTYWVNLGSVQSVPPHGSGNTLAMLAGWPQ